MNNSYVSIAYYFFVMLFMSTFPNPSSANETIKRGEYLTTFGGCHDCHSPKVFTDRGPQPDPTRLLSGYPQDSSLPPLPVEIIGPGKWGAVGSPDLTAWFGPWGVSFAINLTPDPETGMGNWTETQFIEAMRSGKHLGNGRPILPPMPWFSLAALSDSDLQAVFAYLGSIPAIKNRVPEPIPPSN